MPESSTVERGRVLPAGEDSPSIVLAVTCTPVERAIVRRWYDQLHSGGRSHGIELVDVGADPPTSPELLGRLAQLRGDEDPLLTPVRVAWLPGRHGDGTRTARLSDLLRLRNPYKPTPHHQERLVEQAPDRFDVIVAEGARRSELEHRYRTTNSVDGDPSRFAQFVGRQCVLALERAEARRYGEHHKLPRLVREEILASERFRSGIAELSERLDRPQASILDEASGYLEEMVATPSRMIVDIGVQFAKLCNRRAYGTDLNFDRSQLEQLRELSREAPLALLPSHRSYLDYAVLATVLDEARLPPTAGLGGINLAFWPVGPLLRRAGMVFIRRSFRDNHVYKLVLRQYVGYLAEKRFSMMWSIEGGRTRTGKLGQPRMGLLAYVAGAFLDGRCDDYYLIPLSIIYEELLDVEDHRSYALGGAKRAENLGWFLHYIRSQRRDYRHAQVHVAIGEPVSLRRSLQATETSGDDPTADDSVALQKVAFEVAVRINRATPVTATAIVSLVLLGAGRALRFDQLMLALADPLHFVRERALPTPATYPVSTKAGVEAALASLVRHDVATKYPGPTGPAYGIGPRSAIAGAYYRNSISHYFLAPAIVELALLGAASSSDPVSEFWRRAADLRDTLKFEFFFPDREHFDAELTTELERLDPAWEDTLRTQTDDIHDTVRRTRPYSSHLVLRSFLDAYLIVADTLVAHGDLALTDEPSLQRECIERGRQYLAQGLILSAESTSQVIHRNALKLAQHRRLVVDDDDQLGDRRRRFAEELYAVVHASRRIALWADARIDDIIGIDRLHFDHPDAGGHA